MGTVHTVATMEVTQSTYDEVKAKMVAAGYDHAIDENGMLDMHGIGLVLAEPAPMGVPGGDYTTLANLGASAEGPATNG